MAKNVLQLTGSWFKYFVLSRNRMLHSIILLILSLYLVTLIYLRKFTVFFRHGILKPIKPIAVAALKAIANKLIEECHLGSAGTLSKKKHKTGPQRKRKVYYNNNNKVTKK